MDKDSYSYVKLVMQLERCKEDQLEVAVKDIISNILRHLGATNWQPTRSQNIYLAYKKAKELGFENGVAIAYFIQGADEVWMANQSTPARARGQMFGMSLIK